MNITYKFLTFISLLTFSTLANNPAFAEIQGKKWKTKPSEYVAASGKARVEFFKQLGKQPQMTAAEKKELWKQLSEKAQNAYNKENLQMYTRIIDIQEKAHDRILASVNLDSPDEDDETPIAESKKEFVVDKINSKVNVDHKKTTVTPLIVIPGGAEEVSFSNPSSKHK